ncbi:hypothetical protein FI667_g9530, partial [Globisporangium splendens]
MDPQYATGQRPAPAQQQQQLGDADEMQHMWQFLDSTLTTGTTLNGMSPAPTLDATHANDTNGNNNAMVMAAQYGAAGGANGSSGAVLAPPHEANAARMLHPVAATRQQQTSPHDARESTLNEDENGMYNELGDVFSMFFNIDSDEPQQHHLGGNAAAALAYAQAQQMNNANGGNVAGGAPRYVDSGAAENTGNQKVQLPRSASASSSHSGMDSISPGLLGYPSMSPATINWLQSLAKSTSSESLSGLVSPATLYGTPSALLPGSASGNLVGDGTDALERTQSCEMIDWKAYNEAGEKAQKDAPKWRVIPQHGPHADPTTAANSNGNAYQQHASSSAKPPTGSVTIQNIDTGARMDNVSPTSEGGLRNHFTRQFQTIKSTVVSLVGALSSAEETAARQSYQAIQGPYAGGASGAPASSQPMFSQSAQEQLDLAAKKMAEEKNKRKAIISPEYVQYGSNSVSSAPLPGGGLFGESISTSIKSESDHLSTQFASQVPDPTGRRPSKKSLHQTGYPSQGISLDQQQPQSTFSIQEQDDPNSSAIRCKCTGKCRNARCACVKAGFVCGVHCKCVSCANPFVPMEKEGINVQKMVQDVCLMQFLSKVKDMQELLDSTVTYECCNEEVQVKKTIENGFTCPTCQVHYTYSWCSNRLCHDQKKPRKHCAKCRRCGDHRNEHCDDCNHCYFAGVANSFSCSCKGGKTGRAVIPNINRDNDASGLRAKAEGGNNSASNDSSHSRDENANPLLNQSSSNASQTNSSGGNIANGLSSSEAEKDDACPVQ